MALIVGFVVFAVLAIAVAAVSYAMVSRRAAGAR